MHDALEDTQDIDASMIQQFLGYNVARRVRLLTKIPKEGYFERLRYADMYTNGIKLCDRLDNLRSLPEDDAFVNKTLNETNKMLSSINVSFKEFDPVLHEINSILFR